MTIHVSEKPHATLGPSGWHTWGACPGSVPLSAGLPRTSNKYADEGTAAHALLEEVLRTGKDAEAFLGEDIIVSGEAWIVDMDMCDAVNSSVDIIKSYVKAGDVLHVEQSVPLAQMTGEEGAEGTADVAGITENGTHLHIFDFKYGKGVQIYASDLVDVLDDPNVAKRPNGQLAMYALGWLEKHGFLYEEVTKVTLHVLQPRLEWHDEYTLGITELRAFEDVIRDAAGRVELNRQVHAEGNELDLVPGEKQCRFCKAKAHCPALRDQVSTSLALVSDVSDFEDLTLPKQAASVTVNQQVSSEKLAEFMRAVPLIEAAIEAARAEVERRLFAGDAVPGFYLGEGRRGNRAWVNGEEAEKLLKRWLKVEGAYERKLISPAKAEKALKGDPKKWKKLEALLGQADGKPSVCRDGDKNAPYIATKAEAFENLDAIEAIPPHTPLATAFSDSLALSNIMD